MFSDIANHWASACIVALARRELIRGYPNGAFRPNGIITRAEYAALMRQSFPELIESETAIAFQDVFVEHWAGDAIAWATRTGLFQGYSNNRFLPQQPISRVQAVVVMMAAISSEQASEAVSAPEAASEAQQIASLAAQTFSDADEIPAYAIAAVGLAIQQRLLEPLPEPRPLYPGRPMTRGELAGLLCRALDIPAEELTVSYSGLAQTRRSLFQGFLAQEASFDAEKLAFLDKGIRRSPLRSSVNKAAERLQLPPGIPQFFERSAPYPAIGDRPALDAGGLDFLSPQVLSGCLCLGGQANSQLSARWLGREAFDPRQMWSSTKFIPLLNLIDRVNAVAPFSDIDQCRIRRVGGQGGFPFNSLASGIMSYDNRIATSNSIAAMFKHFETPARLEKWLQAMTGNRQLSFQGRYGEVPFIEYPELWDTKSRRVLVKSPGKVHQGDNLVSTYDLTRMITLAGWHWRLPQGAKLPNVQTHSLESVIRAMGVDTARYIEVALEALGLMDAVVDPVVISKSGFGRSDQRDRTELTYCALVQFSLPRYQASDPTASLQTFSFGLTLIVAQQTGDVNQEARSVDALMSAEVTEVIRRIVTDEI